MTENEKYECPLCNYSTTRLSNWTRHINSKKHKSCVEKKIILEQKYVCDTCNFKTNKLSSWNRHINTKRHKSKKIAAKQISSIHKIADNIDTLKKYKCEKCDECFNSRTTLWRHRKTCSGKCEEVSDLTTSMDSLDLNSKEGKNLILEVLKQQGETIKAMAQERTMMMDQMKSTIIGNNNNNNYININMFLNEECANAMSIQNFAKKLQITLDDLARNNKREAISNIVIKNLKPLAITERPVHFKDKSEWYIKDEDEGWNEDNGEKLIQAASFGIQRNWSAEFEKEYPTWMKNEKLRDLYVKLAGTSSSDVTEREKLTILKEVAEACNLPKNIDEVIE
tara:strand:- start:2965 stop:3978 length:1014 start_codon:yes stop_codon:yes gene_type:complete